MEKTIYGFIMVIVGLAFILFLYQFMLTAKIRRGVKLMLKWFDYIIDNPTDFDFKTTRELGEDVDRYFQSKDIGKRVMYFAPKLKDYIVDRYGKLPGETNEDAFWRLAHWEGDHVRFDVYWTMIQGGFAEYAEALSKGKRPTFAGVSAPMAIIRKYWKM
ncbi:hypothetical protein KAH81_09630 [bacterium]|nr:hypothetical protein [bacterium]